MIKLEDILDDALRYLRGEMDAEERSFFEELLDRNPHLREELRFIQLVRAGLQQIAEYPTPPTNRTWPQKNAWKIALLLVSLLGSLLFWLFLFQRPVHNPDKSQLNSPVIHVNQMEKKTYIKIEHGGGNNSSIDSNRGLAVHWTPSGEFVFGGTFAGDGSLGSQSFSSKGKRDILFGSYNLKNGFNWVLPLGGDQTNDILQGIAVDSKNNLIITGGFGSRVDFGNQIVQATGTDDEGNHDFFIAKYDPNGELQWIDHGGGQWVAHQQTGVNTGLAVIIDDLDDIIVCGSYIGSPVLGNKTLPIGGPNEELFLAKYTPDGNIQWVETITGQYMIYGFELGADADRNIYISGAFGHHNLGGQAYFGTDTLKSYGGKDMFLAKYSREGKLIWVQQAGSPLNEQGYDMANSLAVDQEGNCVIAGVFTGQALFGSQSLSSYGGRDIFLAKYNTNGQLIWVRQAGSRQTADPKGDMANAVALSKDGHIFVTGSFTGTALFDRDTLKTGKKSNFFLAKYTPEGELLWSTQFEGLNDFQEAAGLGIDAHPNGNIVVTGFFSGSIRIGSQTLSSKGNGDIFILIFNEEGDIVSAETVIVYM